MTRQPAQQGVSFDDYRFEIGKAKLLRDGADVLFVSTGLMTMRTLDAAEKLAADNISVAVLHVSTLKPLDAQTIVDQARKSGRLVIVAENHSVVGGLGEALARTFLLEGVAPKFRHIGLPDQFLDAGALPTLHDRYGISTSEIMRQVQSWLK